MPLERNEDGSLNWLENEPKKHNRLAYPISKKEIENVDMNPFQNFFNLYACNIQTSIIGESIIIDSESDYAYIVLDRITDFELAFDLIRLNTTDEISYYLSFVSEVEAISAYVKLETAISGEELSCDETIKNDVLTLEKYSDELNKAVFPAIIFIDNGQPFEVESKLDLIVKLNEIYTDKISFSNNSNPWLINVLYYPYKSIFIPKEIKILQKYIPLTVKGNKLKLNIDMQGEKFYVFAYGKQIVDVNDVFEMPFSGDNNVRLYFATYFVNTFEIGLAERVLFINNQSVNLDGKLNVPSIHKLITSTTLDNLNTLLAQSFKMQEVVMENNFNSDTLAFDNYQLKSINIKNCSSENITFPSTLNTLSLYNCNIESFNHSLPNLKNLDIEGCGKLTSINVEDSNLKKLFIVNCPITSFHINQTFSEMIEFKMVYTKMTSFPLPYLSMTLINYIDISFNSNISLINYKTFWETFCGYNKIQGGFFRTITDHELTELDKEEFYPLTSKGWYIIF